jgi:hypothetical protein
MDQITMAVASGNGSDWLSRHWYTVLLTIGSDSCHLPILHAICYIDYNNSSDNSVRIRKKQIKQ